MSEETFKTIQESMTDIPSLPVVASRILRIIANEGSSLEELKKVISMDQSFSARLLRVANSPYYRASNKIGDITDAITRIGFTTVQALVFAVSLKDLRRSADKTDRLLWEHNLAVSVASSLIARESGLALADDPFILGLLHDIGKVVLNYTNKKQYTQVIQKVAESDVPFVDAENEIFGFDHCAAGEHVARQWQLPESICFVIANHHSPDALSITETDLKKKTLIVKAADALSASIGLGLSHTRELDDGEWQYLKLTTAKKREALQCRIEEAYKVYHDFVMGPVQA
jgi:HD-like signal output (HDOD) protein